MFARNQAAYKSQEKAIISFGDDRVKDKRSIKLVGVVGYPIPIKGLNDSDAYQTAEIVPYFGVNRDTSKTGSAARAVTTNNWRLGVLFDYTLANSASAHYFVARPEYIFNRKEKSEVASLNLSYVPFVQLPLGFALNRYYYLVPGRDDLFSFRPILDVRFNNGTYAVRGLRAAEDSRDFSRIGGRAGLTLSSDILALPADLTVSETYLHGLAGAPNDLSQFKAVLALGLSSDRNIGIDIVYVNGRREDLADREEGWTIGLGLKF